VSLLSISDLTEGLNARLAAFSDGDMTSILDPRAQYEAELLFRSMTDQQEFRAEGILALAWLYWYRYQTLPPDQNEPGIPDVQGAVAMGSEPGPNIDSRSAQRRL
jgi:hypothetical protein